MADPHVFLLHGEDDFALAEEMGKITAQLGDPVLAEMNTMRLDGRSNSIDNLVQAVNSLPFLAAMRLVVFAHPTDCARHPAHQKRLLEVLGKVPPTTLLVMVEDHQLLPKDKKKTPLHWLDKWAQEAGPGVKVLLKNLPSGTDLNRWIQARAKSAGGQISAPAANKLADTIGPEPRILQTEIHKLLAYVNYARPVDEDDVEHVSTRIERLESFALVNALRAHNTQMALKALRLELEERDPLMVLAGIVGQFRSLLLARELLEKGGQADDLARAMSIHPYVAKLAIDQARSFSPGELENIFRHLIEIDEAMKSSGDHVAELNVLVAQLSLP